MDLDELDIDLMQRLATGDEAAFDRLYDRHSASAYGLALRVTNDRALAEDAVQEAFLNLWRSADSFKADRASVRTWLLSITHHRAVDVVRRRRGAMLPIDELAAAGATEPALREPDLWPLVTARLDAQSIRRALDSIPEPQRVALNLAYFGGLTQAEIAARMEIPVGTVKSRVRLGLKRLSVLLNTEIAPTEQPSQPMPDVGLAVATS